MVRKSIQTILKSFKHIAIPFGVVSTASLSSVFNTAHAETIGDVIFQKRGILLHGSDGKGLIGGTKQLAHNIESITGKIMEGIDWIMNLPFSIPKLSADLLTLIYNLLSDIALKTPLFLFNNPVIKNTSLTFALISISIVTLLTIYESFMQMMKKEHTDFKTIAKRWALIASISGFMPFAFEKGFEYLNTFSEAISNIGNVNGGNKLGLVSPSRMGLFDTLIIILFDLTAISMIIPFAMQAGRRWFDLLVLCAISPLALSAYVFDRHRHHFRKWINEVKSLSIVQLVQAVFILLMGIFIFSTQAIQGGMFVMICKLLVVLGGLYRLCNPPRMVTQLADGGSDDVMDMYNHYKKSFLDVKDTLTGKKFTQPSNFIGGIIQKRKEDKMKEKYGVRHLDVDEITKNLRIKHGRRHVKDLL